MGRANLSPSFSAPGKAGAIRNLLLKNYYENFNRMRFGLRLRKGIS
jgi:hypothetical protein